MALGAFGVIEVSEIRYSSLVFWRPVEQLSTIVKRLLGLLTVGQVGQSARWGGVLPPADN